MDIRERINGILHPRKEAAVKLPDLLREGVFLCLEDPNRDDALRSLVRSLRDAGTVHNGDEFYDAILRREGIVSTGIGMGIAIPHAKFEKFEHFFLAVGVHSTGLDWDSLDGLPVRVIFLIGGPSEKQTEYLQILEQLTSAIKDEELRRELYNIQSKDELLALFSPS